MKNFLPIANLLALLVTIFFNYLSNTGTINGETMATVSAQYQNYFTPAGYAFSIWGLIYLGLLGFVIFQLNRKNSLNNTIREQVGPWFIVSCLANVLWIFAWLHHQLALSVLIMIVLLISLLMIMFRTGMELEKVPFEKILFCWWPFAIYLGWITVALIANMAAWLTQIQWNGLGIDPVNWTVIMILAAGIVYLLLTWSRNLRESALVAIWALVAIAIANRGDQPLIVQVSLAMTLILVISTAMHAWKNVKVLPWK